MTEKIKPGSPRVPAPQAAANGRKPAAAEREWEEKTLRPTLAKSPERAAEFTTVSSYPIKRLYTPADLADWDPDRDLGLPGQPPYTRGIHPTMYRSRLWTMRQFAGFGTAEDTNARFRYLLVAGADRTFRGLRSAYADGLRLGSCAVATAKWGNAAWRSVRWRIWKRCSTRFRWPSVTTSMTINSPAAVIWAMYLAVAEKQGADWKKLSGTLQNDILKEYIAQKEYIYPPEPSLRLVIDTIEFGARHTPQVQSRSRSAAITFAKRARRRFRNWRSRCATASNTWSGHSGAGWTWMNSRRGFRSSSTRTTISSRKSPSTARRGASGTKPCASASARRSARSWALRFHAQTAGCSLTAQQPYNNVVRTAIQALAAVHGRNAIAAHQFAG